MILLSGLTVALLLVSFAGNFAVYLQCSNHHNYSHGLIFFSESQKSVECLTSCGTDAGILSIEENIYECCDGSSAANAFSIPGSELLGCQLCTDYDRKMCILIL